MFKQAILFHKKYGVIIPLLVLVFCMSYLFMKLTFPSKRVQNLIGIGVRAIESDTAVIDYFGVIKSTSLRSDEIGREAGSKRSTPGEARIVLKIIGEKKEGYVRIHYTQASSKWMYQKHEILGGD